MSSKRIICSDRGVTLTETTLHGSGGVAMAVGYTLQSKRTPVGQSFDNLAAALAAFEAEVALCS